MSALPASGVLQRTPAPTRSSSSIKPRLWLIVMVWVYAYSIHWAHIEYLNTVWEYFGFSYSEPDSLTVAFILCLITIAAAVLPLKVDRPSSIILLLLFIVVYIPTVVLTLCLSDTSSARYGLILIAMAISFSGACVILKQFRYHHLESQYIPGDALDNTLFFVWLIFCAILIYSYGSIMKLVDLEDIYGQRSAGASTNLAMGYVQTYFSNIISPALIALGLVKKRYWLIPIGIAGCVIMYMINAQRTIFLFPFVIIGLYFALDSKKSFFNSSAAPILFVAILVFICASYQDDNLVATFLSLFVIFRTLALPGLTFSQYYDVFETSGFTWWSHVRGLDLFIAPPSFFANHIKWPGLGYIVGDRFYQNVENNVNANLFSGDGVAAAGAFGIIVIGIVFSIWLVYLDRVSRRWNSTLAVLLVTPVGFSLTNGHLSTTLLSFGGFFWLLIFIYYKPRSGMNAAHKTKTKTAP
jgi:hypothetical protein